MGSVIERFREEDRKEAIKEGMEEGIKKGIKKGIKEGMSTLTGAVQDMKAGMSYDELVKKYGQTTADFAKACR